MHAQTDAGMVTRSTLAISPLGHHHSPSPPASILEALMCGCQARHAQPARARTTNSSHLVTPLPSWCALCTFAADTIHMLPKHGACGVLKWAGKTPQLVCSQSSIRSTKGDYSSCMAQQAEAPTFPLHCVALCYLLLIDPFWNTEHIGSILHPVRPGRSPWQCGIRHAHAGAAANQDLAARHGPGTGHQRGIHRRQLRRPVCASTPAAM